MIVDTLKKIVIFCFLLIIESTLAQSEEMKLTISIDQLKKNHVCKSEKDVWILMHALKYHLEDGYKKAFTHLEKKGKCWEASTLAIRMKTLHTRVKMMSGKKGFVEFIIISYIEIPSMQKLELLLLELHKY